MINSRTYRTYHLHVSTSQSNAGQLTPANKYRQVFLQTGSHNWFQYLVHISIWVFVYFLPLLLNPGSSNGASYYLANIIHVLSFALLVSFWYLNYYWLTPELFIKKLYARYFLLAAVFLAAIAGSEIMIATVTALPSASGEPAFVVSGILYSLCLFVSILCLPIIIRLRQLTAAAEKELLKINTALVNTRLQPQFLFNTLDWMYLLAVKKQARVPGAVLQLSGMMRYVVYETGNEFTHLTKELAYIRNYISLQKAMLGDSVPVKYSPPAYTGPGKIAPMLLIAVIENAFGCGAGSKEDAAIDIDINITGSQLCLQVINTTLTEAGNNSSAAVSNLQQRLNLLYPRMHQLEILENSKIYSVKLSIDIV